MTRFLALIAVLFFANPLPAQEAAKQAFTDADKEAAWQELFDGVTLKDCEVLGGSHIKDRALVLVGGANSKLRLKAPLGDQFKLLIECRVDGPSMPSLVFETSTFLSRGASGGTLSGNPGEWRELLLVGKTAPGGRAVLDAYDRKLGDKPAHGGGQYGGEGRCTVSLDVPAGTTLTIRRIRLQTTAPPASAAGVFIALGVLALVILLVIAGGWYLHRRQPAANAG